MANKVITGGMSSEMITEVMAKPVIARLATADPDTHKPHVVPVWFAWDGESLWVSSFSNTRKIKNLYKNPNCSVVVDTNESALTYQAILLEGQAELISQPTELIQEMSTHIYTRYLGAEGVLAPEPQSWIRDPENTLIKLTPEHLRSWYSKEI